MILRSKVQMSTVHTLQYLLLIQQYFEHIASAVLLWPHHEKVKGHFRVSEVP